ncbi:MAG: DUF2079 domain-containing protein [Bacteroidetes bacterium]|nr:MAG: DUF2079 domain-containing protein [Bacteroidota bacterium]
MTKRNLLFILIFLCTVAVVVLNEINLNYLDGRRPSSNGLITTADEYSYLQPPRSFFNTGVWSGGDLKNTDYTRTPGYGLIFLSCQIISSSQPYLVLKLFQILSFSLSLYLLYLIIFQITISHRLGIISILIYTVIPSYHGFTYYTLTESVIPFFVLLALYFFLNINLRRAKVYLTVCLSFLLLIRPQLIPLYLVLVVFLIVYDRKSIWMALLAILPLGFWMIKATNATKNISLHPIYSNKNNNEYREPHKEMTELFKVWEFRSDRFHQTIGILSKDTTQTTRHLALRNVPEKFRGEITHLFQSYQMYRFEQRKLTKPFTVKTRIKGESELIQEIQKSRQQLTKDYFVDYYVLTPVKSAYRMFASSMMNLHVFQSAWKNSIVIQILKIISFLLLITGVVSSFFILFLRTPIQLKMFALASLLSILYLVFFQRLNEERYIVPYMSIWLICLLVSIHELKKKGKLSLPFSNKK